MKSNTALLEYFLANPYVFTDTRKVVVGGIFFALKGERFNGNKFAKDALQKGASLAVVDDPEVVENEEQYVLVEDSLIALQDLARSYRQHLNIPVIGITGSNGKTTTKELISSVLAKKYKLFFTQGNLNNHIGVPLTLLSIPADAALAVVEMGANHVGEIALLSRIARPTHGLITNIGKAHLEGFGGVEGIKKGKSELYDFLAAHGGIAFINSNEKFLSELSKHVKERIFYGDDTDVQLSISFELLQSDPFVNLKVNENLTINSNLVGAYNYNNIITAIAIGNYFEVEMKDIKEAVASYIPSNNRSQLVEKGSNKIILDAYNANPTSMKAALQYFASVDHSHKVVILGDMLELGAYTKEEHSNIINLVKKIKKVKGLFVGPAFGEVLQDSSDFLHYEKIENLIEYWPQLNIDNALILMKGSRGIKVEKLLESL